MTDYITHHQRHFDLKKFIVHALHEDVGDGDHTSRAIIAPGQKGKMRLLVKENGILAGVEAATRIFKTIDPSFAIKILLKDGATIKKGDVAFTVDGNSRNLLLAERLVLNVMQRMSGIATKAFKLQQQCTGTKAKVIDTRKTTPGFRFFEKWAVVIGGAANHRFGLYDMILIKDNHIDFAGGVENAIGQVQQYLKRTKRKLRIEIEVRNLSDLKKVLAFGGVHRIMLDNFTPAQTRSAVKLIAGKYEIESSGGITEKNLRSFALCGVDFISIGALTHHIEGLDMSLKAMK